MTRQIGDDGIAEEEFNFNTQIVLQSQVSNTHLLDHTDPFIRISARIMFGKGNTNLENQGFSIVFILLVIIDNN